MLKYVLTAALAATLFALVPASSSFAQAPRPDVTAKPPAAKPAAAKPAASATGSEEKKLSPQQAKMKECGAKWQAHKKEANVSGRAEHRKFMSTCLKA
jgi:outer membrane receptor for monomeric catechols